MYDELVKRLRDCAEVNSLSLYKRGLMTQAADAIESMSEAYDKLSLHMDDLAALMPRWIPVTERLPEDKQCVLVTGKTGEINLARYEHPFFDFGENITSRVGKVTHWLPLPELPKEE